MNCASGGSEDVQRGRQRFTCLWEGFSFKSRGEMVLYQLGHPLKLPPLFDTCTLKRNGLLVTLQFHFIHHKKKQWKKKNPLNPFLFFQISLLDTNASVYLSSCTATSRCQGLTSRRYCCSSWLQYTRNQCGICTSRQTEVTLVSPSCCISHNFLVNSPSLSVSQAVSQAGRQSGSQSGTPWACRWDTQYFPASVFCRPEQITNTVSLELKCSWATLLCHSEHILNFKPACVLLGHQTDAHC